MWTVLVFIKSDFEVRVDDRSATCQPTMEVQSTDASILRQVVHDSAGSLRSRSHLVSQADTSALDQDGFGEITPVIVTASCAHRHISLGRASWRLSHVRPSRLVNRLAHPQHSLDGAQRAQP